MLDYIYFILRAHHSYCIQHILNNTLFMVYFIIG